MSVGKAAGGKKKAGQAGRIVQVGKTVRTGANGHAAKNGHIAEARAGAKNDAPTGQSYRPSDKEPFMNERRSLVHPSQPLSLPNKLVVQIDRRTHGASLGGDMHELYIS